MAGLSEINFAAQDYPKVSWLGVKSA